MSRQSSTKIVVLTVEVPAKYNWVAQQPWGQWTAFTHKPRVFVDKKLSPPTTYWEAAKGDHEDLTAERDTVNTPKWKSTLIKINNRK